MLRYGENPHQPAALYPNGFGPAGLAQAAQLHGKEMSYNNYVDADAARRAAYDFDEPAVAIIKHANPCGIAVGADVAEAHRKAHECDPVSAFGGVIATNRPVSVEMAEQVAEIFTEVVVAPAYEDGAVEILQGKKNVRLLECEPLAPRRRRDAPDLRRPADAAARRVDADGRRPVELDPGHRRGRLRARCSPTSRSPGGPAAPPSPTRSCSPPAAPRSASAWARSTGSTRASSRSTRAGERAAGSVAASDAFFPFEDGPQILIDAGVNAIVQPGGSVRDELTIEAAKKAGVTMYFTGTRHFAH